MGTISLRNRSRYEIYFQPLKVCIAPINAGLFYFMERIKIHFKELSLVNTPNTYDRNFKEVPKKSGVYFFVAPYYHDYVSLIGGSEYYEIIYIGSSKNLFNRYNNHELRRKNIFDLKFYFIESENYYEDEIKLIKYFQPIYNYKHNPKYKNA